MVLPTGTEEGRSERARGGFNGGISQGFIVSKMTNSAGKWLVAVAEYDKQGDLSMQKRRVTQSNGRDMEATVKKLPSLCSQTKA